MRAQIFKSLLMLTLLFGAQVSHSTFIDQNQVGSEGQLHRFDCRLGRIEWFHIYEYSEEQSVTFHNPKDGSEMTNRFRYVLCRETHLGRGTQCTTDSLMQRPLARMTAGGQRFHMLGHYRDCLRSFLNQAEATAAAEAEANRQDELYEGMTTAP